MIMLLSSDYQILIQLIQREIWPGSSIGTKVHHDQAVMQQDKNIVRLLSDCTTEGWTQMFKMAARQGLLAIAWDALEELQAEYGGLCRGMSRETKIRWALSIKNIEEVHLRQREALKELAGIFAESGMRVMVLKGLGLADMYPRPAHRECGDLDIYLFGDFEKGNEVMRKMGIAVEYDGTKHSKFNYKGIPVENHKNFLNVTTTRVDKDLERELMRMLQEQKCGSLDLGGITVDVPPPDFHNKACWTLYCTSFEILTWTAFAHIPGIISGPRMPSILMISRDCLNTSPWILRSSAMLFPPVPSYTESPPSIQSKRSAGPMSNSWSKPTAPI
jgi:hypothetical protein